MRENLNAENEKLKEEAAIQKEFELELQQIKAAKQNLMDEMASLKEESEKKRINRKRIGQIKKSRWKSRGPD